MKIFIDQDDVLFDFAGTLQRTIGKYCYNKPEHMGNWDMAGCLGISKSEFWEPTNNFEFWATLPKTPDADIIMETCVRLVGWENIAILTSPSLHPMCIPAKRQSIVTHYPKLSNQIIFAYSKGFIGGPNKLIIDDRDRNVDDFRAAGGSAILVPHYWNRRWRDKQSGEYNLQEEIESNVQLVA